jgi:hypothetical protein
MYANGFCFSRRLYAADPRPLKYPYGFPEQFVGLRLALLVEPDLSTTDPVFSEAKWPASADDWNKEHLKRRFRVDRDYTCPEGKPQSFPCHFCSTGFLKCPAATHMHDWYQGRCNACDKNDAYFDPDISRELCVDCFIKEVYRASKK